MAKALNINVITTAVKAAFKAGDTYDAQIVILQRECKGADRDTIKAIVCPIAAAKYDAEYVDGKWVDSKCAAKRHANRVIAAVMGTASNASEPKAAVRLPKALVSSITDEIIGAGLTKAQFDALLTQLKAAITFE
jgi:hypothetical protein